MAEEIIITIDTEGNPTIAVAGVAGASCKDLTKALEASLGNTTSDTKTKEFYERERTSVCNSSQR